MIDYSATRIKRDAIFAGLARLDTSWTQSRCPSESPSRSPSPYSAGQARPAGRRSLSLAVGVSPRTTAGPKGVELSSAKDTLTLKPLNQLVVIHYGRTISKKLFSIKTRAWELCILQARVSTDQLQISKFGVFEPF